MEGAGAGRLNIIVGLAFCLKSGLSFRPYKLWRGRGQGG